jgi:hypothetical protein
VVLRSVLNNRKRGISRGKEINSDHRRGVWLDARGEIHIACRVNGVRVISTVSSRPESKRYHPNLYRKLNKAMTRGLTGEPGPAE